jgi:hypothetical protein
MPRTPVGVVFERTYPARCPARGLATMGSSHPLVVVYAGETTSETQIRAVLAHEIVHQLTSGESFVGDGVLTEGIANYGADHMMLAWQGYESWEEAVLDYIARDGYVSIAAANPLSPTDDEDCIARRDRVYNTRSAFVAWLVDRIGLEAVIAMPFIEAPTRDPTTGQVILVEETGEIQMDRQPDYRAATGHDLATLELIWLAELWAAR